MDLNFELQGGYFIAEFEVTSDFNLHIEKDPIGEFLVYQRTAGGQYDLVQNFKKDKGNDSIIDYDFQALVYPKWIKIKSSVEPLVATIVYNASAGGGSSEGSGDDVIFFDGQMLYSEFGNDIMYIFNTLFGMSSFINKTTYYMETFNGKKSCSEGIINVAGFSIENVAYICVSNSLTPSIVLMGSGGLEIPEQENPLTVFEFLEIVNELGMTIPVDLFKQAEVSREVVEQWMQEE